MPRPKAFERDEALARAMDLFWRHGYEATSLQELVDHMGIGRSSLYDTFGSKHALWAEALELYAARTRNELLAPLRRPGTPRERLAALHAHVIEQAVAGELRSCLMLKALVTTGEHCATTADTARRCMLALEDALCALLEEARASGALRAAASPRSLARAQLAVLHGLGVAAAVDRNRERLADISEVALSLLD